MTRPHGERAAGRAGRLVMLAAWLGAGALATASAAAQEPPAELRGTVTSVSGDRITIGLANPEWLPKLGTEITIGLEMSGQFVPLKGRFVVVQVNADSCAAHPVRGVEHGDAATGMLAALKTAYPNRPGSRADYTASVARLEQMLPLADTGDPNAQAAVAMAYESIGDADHALPMWERAQASARERLLIHNAATRRVEILEMRGQYEDAVVVLQDAVARTAPTGAELAWPFYQQPPGMAVEWHVELLTALAGLYRVQLRDRAQADPWERKVVEVMAAAATRGAPPAEGETPFRYLGLLMDLGMRLRDLDDVEAAVPWYQMAARRGHEPAQRVLKELGRSW